MRDLDAAIHGIAEWERGVPLYDAICGQQIVHERLLFAIENHIGGTPGWVRKAQQGGAPVRPGACLGEVRTHLYPGFLLLGAHRGDFYGYYVFDLLNVAYDLKELHSEKRSPRRPAPHLTCLPPAWLVLR